MKLTMCGSVICGNLQAMKLDLAFVRFLSLQWDNNFKSKKGLDKLRKGLLLYFHRSMSILDVKELTVDIMKYGVK